MTADMPRPGDAPRDGRVLPTGPGPRPRTRPWAPHVEEDQNVPAAMEALLAWWVLALPEVEERADTVAHPAERAIWLRDEVPAAPGDVFLGNREIGRVHPWDGSLHIVSAVQRAAGQQAPRAARP